jgi:hypothetical protein
MPRLFYLLMAGRVCPSAPLKGIHNRLRGEIVEALLADHE